MFGDQCAMWYWVFLGCGRYLYQSHWNASWSFMLNQMTVMWCNWRCCGPVEKCAFDRMQSKPICIVTFTESNRIIAIKPTTPSFTMPRKVASHPSSYIKFAGAKKIISFSETLAPSVIRSGVNKEMICGAAGNVMTRWNAGLHNSTVRKWKKNWTWNYLCFVCLFR